MRVAVIGGGQLARMMQEAASALGIPLAALVEARDGSTGQVVPDAVVGAPDDEDRVRALAERSAVLTFEHEHQATALLERLQAEGYSVQPSPAALLYARDKLAMRRRLGELGVPIPHWRQIRSETDLEEFLAQHGGRAIVKTARGGYDGKGVRAVEKSEEVGDWLEAMAAGGVELLAEEQVDFTCEVAALLARRPSGELRTWPVAETRQVDGVCSTVLAPAPDLDDRLAARAQEIAEQIAVGLNVTGVLAVEMFLSGDRLTVNELAMRPHNSGHWTIEGATTSQFEQHLRAVLDLPLGDTTPVAPHAVMVNLLGSVHEDPRHAYPEALGRYPEVKVHLYGKEVRPGRKLGHVTAIGEDLAELESRAAGAVAVLKGVE
ncbi:MAG: 5-(carboxyamino)imidazole ribonucleotide synthase [Bowdeniella nasicola]|nr:5-(carboxyamino)imidazole ribonucleotide synthase [Bowdeniella nasicola]